MNYRKLIVQLQEAGINSNADRETYIALLAKQPFANKAHLYAFLVNAMGNDCVAPKGSQWDSMTQDQRELLTVYGQSARKLGFIA